MKFQLSRTVLSFLKLIDHTNARVAEYAKKSKNLANFEIEIIKIKHMDRLEDLLNKPKPDMSSEAVSKLFHEIAESLMGNYIIKKGKKRYAIVEIEFYLYTPQHKDFITYPRNLKAGRWFFHQSGVDLTFNTLGEPTKDINKKGKECLNYKDCSFGGILIRGLYLIDKNFEEDFNKDNFIFGPLKCVNILWDDFNAFENSDNEYPVIIEANEKEKVILQQISLRKCKRCINVENKKEKVDEWAERIAVKTPYYGNDTITYYNELFNFNTEYLYRFFNLPISINPSDFTKIPKDARPKEDEIHEVK